MELGIPTIAWATVAIAGACAVAILRRLVLKTNMPPGPKGLPILQNILDFPTEYAWLAFEDMAKKYGSIFSLKVLGHDFVVLNTAHAVREILMKRGSHCASRMRYTMYEHAGWEDDIHIVSQAGLRTMKHFSVKKLGPNSRSQFVEAVDKEVASFIQRLLPHKGTIDPTMHARRLTGSVILRIAYGYEVKSDDDEFIKLSENALEVALELLSPGWIIDILPWTRYIPDWMHGPKFVRTVSRSRELVHRLRNEPIDWVKQQIAAGVAKPSLAADLLLSTDQNDNHLLFILLADFYGAGMDTTLSVITTLFLMLALYPEVQAKAQAEVDSVTLDERLPMFSDRDRLPYVTALVKELFRFPGVVNMGFPHRVTQAIEYQGYILSENTLVMANVWTILHDPIKYPDPFVFKPERFMGETSNAFGPDDIVNEDPTRYVFGFEPRRCLGRHLVDSTLFLLASKVLATFNISNAVDELGSPIAPSRIQYTGGFVSRPFPYTCTIEPRPNSSILLSGESGFA